MKRIFFQLLSFGFLIILLGCESAEKPARLATAPVSGGASPVLKHPFIDPVTPTLYELPSGALATWRQFAGRKPALLLFSAHPLLQPLPEPGREELINFLRQAQAEEIIRRSRFFNENPAFLPPETVSAALAAGIFSEIIFVLPTRKPLAEFSRAEFRKRALAAGFLTTTESRELRQQGGVISGQVRGLPFRCVHPEALTSISSPLILHFDLGYFKELYVNEVKTPVYDLLFETATAIQRLQLPVLATTLSYSNEEVGFSLESRFLISNLAEILRRPQLLRGKTPESWSLRAKALYAATMLQEKEARELTLQGAQRSPGDADALYALALLQFSENLPLPAFATLDASVSIDKGYALEFIALAEQGEKLGQWKKAIELLTRAAAIFPENPTIRLKLADALIQRGRSQEARPILASLIGLNWSSLYHPGIPGLLREMSVAAADDSIVALTNEPAPSPPPPRRGMPASHLFSPPTRKP